MKEEIERLFNHLAWANTAVIECLSSLDPAPRKAVDILAHILAAEQVWLCRMRGEPEKAPPVWPAFSLSECRDLFSRNVDSFTATLGSLDEVRLLADVSYVNSRGDRFSNTVRDILLHAFMHGSYHRGQIAALVRAGGGTPINTDYITYVRSQGDGRR